MLKILKISIIECPWIFIVFFGSIAMGWLLLNNIFKWVII